MNITGNKRFLTDEQVTNVRARMDVLTLDERAPYIKWHNVILKRDLAYVPQGPLNPFTIPPGYQSDPTARNTAEYVIVGDMRHVADFATNYVVTGDETYAEAAAAILDVWTAADIQIVNEGASYASIHVWAEHWTIAIQAAMLIHDSAAWTAAREAAFVALTQSTGNQVIDLIPPFRHSNNIADWNACFLIAAGGYIKDADMFTLGIQLWKDNMNVSVTSNFLVRNRGIADGKRFDNILQWEIYRQGGGQGNGSYGLLYSNAAMNPMLCACEYARLNGVWLFDYVTDDGSTLPGVHEMVTGWNYEPTVPNLWFNTSAQQGNPERYYWAEIRAFNEIAEQHWPSEKNAWLLDRWLHAFRGYNYNAGPTPTNPDPTPTDNAKGIRNAEILIRFREG